MRRPHERRDRRIMAHDDIFGDEPAKKKVKAAFVWHIMHAVFALTAVMLVGYLQAEHGQDGQLGRG